MIRDRMKTYSLEIKESGYDDYGQPLFSYATIGTVDVSVSLLTKVINQLDPRYIKATHIGLTYDVSIKEGMKLSSVNDGNYIVKIVNADGRMTQLTLEVS